MNSSVILMDSLPANKRTIKELETYTNEYFKGRNKEISVFGKYFYQQKNVAFCIDSKNCQAFEFTLSILSVQTVFLPTVNSYIFDINGYAIITYSFTANFVCFANKSCVEIGMDMEL